MSHEIVSYSSDESKHQQPANPLLLLHRVLRGRYALAIVLGGVLAVPCSIAGYFVLQPKYTSVGLVRILVSRQPKLDVSELNDPQRGLDTQVSTQAAMLRSERVKTMAVKELSEAGWPGATRGLRMLDRALTVAPVRRADLIRVSVTHTDAALAKAAVNATLTAYIEIQEDESGDLTKRQKELLDELRDNLELRLDALNRHRSLIETNFATSNPVFKLGQLESQRARVEARILNDRVLLIQLGFNQDANHVPGEVDESLASPNEVQAVLLEVLAASDGVLANLLAEEEALDLALQRLFRRFGESHPQRVRLERNLEVIGYIIEARVRKSGTVEGGVVSGVGIVSEVQAARKRLASNNHILEELESRLDRLVRARSDLAQTRSQSKEIQRKLDRTNRSLDSLEVRQLRFDDNMSRAEVFQLGEMPREPSTDRRIPLAVVGFLGGGGLGVGLVVLLGLWRSGLRYIDELETDRVALPLLGCLPDLTEGDATASDMAALSVHHIRSLLEVNRPSGHVSILVTSPAAGDGKTSLALSLASSFAIAGHRTVVVDADLIGRGLSQELGLEDQPGLVEALDATQLNGEIHATATRDLHAVPAGSISGFAPEHLSRERVRAFLKIAGRDHDVVIVDSGPVLGSIEASLFASVADETLLVVERGRHPKVLNAAIDRLSKLGASCTGLIFNRADIGDFARSVSTASIGIGSIMPGSPRGGSHDRSGARLLVQSSASNREEAGAR